MKRLFLLAFALCAMQSSYALIVSIDGEGEVPEQGMQLTITQGEADVLSGRYIMTLEGEVLASSGQLTVQITRSAEGMEDEFCCADNCTAGNGLMQEAHTFTLSGLSRWYVHYMPTPGSDVTVNYLFSDGEQSRLLTVQYHYVSDGVPDTENDASAAHAGKVMHNGQLMISRNGEYYTPNGICIK